MPENETEIDQQLRQILWACYERWQADEYKGDICYSGVVKVYENEFKTKFHHSRLRRLANLGFLSPGETSRAGGRRYYAIVNPDQVEELLKNWGMK